VHFANGAFHHSLPKAGDSDWPEYRKICRRVWDHSNRGTGHDRYGKFMVEIEPKDHPITSGMETFQTTDELYFGQVGTEPISVLATARSTVTGKQEPMAFVYEYEQARVFQTVLGHSVESLQTEGTAELLRRAAPWVTRREQLRPGQLKPFASSSTPLNQESLADGKFKKGLNASAGGAWIQGQPEFGEQPLTFECWIKLQSKEKYNIIVAHEEKSSGTHWELFTLPGSGVLTAYMPGQTPDHIHTSRNICDNQWHYIAMVYETHRVRLYVDAKQVAEQKIESKGLPRHPGNLAIGTLVSGLLGCHGVIDEVRLSRGVRTIELPQSPFSLDESTIGLWRFNELGENGTFQDESRHQRTARPTATSAAGNATSEKARTKDHFGVEAVGFQWTEQDSVDNRWNQSDVGPFLASSIFLPDMAPVEKGLSIKVGSPSSRGAVCFDTGRLEWRAAWTGGFLNFHPARFGLIQSPKIAGDLKLASQRTTGWGTSDTQFQKVSLRGNRVVLQYRVGTTMVQESPDLQTEEGQSLFIREFELGDVKESFLIPLFSGRPPFQQQSRHGLTVATSDSGDRMIAFAIAEGIVPFQIHNQTELVLPVAAHAHPRQFKIFSWSGASSDLDTFLRTVERNLKQTSFAQLPLSGDSRWKDPIQTKGTLGTGPGPYLLDTLTLPFDNPYRALMFVSGHDFFSNGDIAVSTVHGDVWIVSGVNDELNQLKWKRFATGLFQPLGLKIIHDQVYVLGRDQITRLVDTNGDREADHYECVNNTYETSTGGHDYVACLETNSIGDFYFVHATRGVVRAPSDGSPCESIATGLRNPNGMSVGPGDVITAAPQEGTWTPASAIMQVSKGDYYGFSGLKITEQRPLGYDLPLCWIPRLVDNSSGGQTWVTSDQWGPLAGQLLHFSFGKCRMMLVLREEVQGTVQGGTVEFPFDFESGVMRGRFSPHDGQLYASGLQGWVSAAIQDGCLQRVRYTGRPIDLPVGIRTLKNGLAITFSRPLDPLSANEIDNYFLQQWNYRYTAGYGSPELRVSSPLEEGRDDVTVRSVTLLEDGCTVFLEIPDLRPVMQMSIQYKLASRDGEPVEQTIVYTIHRLNSESMETSRLNRTAPALPGLLTAEEQAELRPGLTARFEQDGEHDIRRMRMAALSVPEGTAPTLFLKPGSFKVVNEGYLKVSLKGTYQFWLEGSGQAELFLNGIRVLSEQGMFDPSRRVEVSLHRGENRIELRYISPHDGDARFRLMWRGEDFPEEPVPPTLLWSRGNDPALDIADQRRHGQELFKTHRCTNCHSVSTSSDRDEIPRDAPQLQNVGSRLTAEWMAQWLLKPHQLRHQTTMPQLLNPELPEDRQQAADIAAWLHSSRFVSTSERIKLPEAVSDTASKDLIGQGERLFTELGCYACHHFDSPSQSEEYGRLSLAGVSSKFHTDALANFLIQPQAHFQLTRMPDFRLSETESATLSAYLQSRSKESLAPIPELAGADPTRGREQFLRLGCGNCHSTEGLPDSFSPATRVPLRVDSLGGCLQEEPGNAPRISRYVFDQNERTSLHFFLKSNSPASLQTVSPSETAARLFTSLRCAACHSRDHTVSPRAMIAIEEFDTGLLPESLPVLTWTGEKLQPEWMFRFLKGEISEKPRTWLKARMPAFPAYAQDLTAGLAAEHGMAVVPSSHQFQPVLASIGHELSHKKIGLDCRQCHAVGEEQPAGDKNTQIALGINFVQVRERLRPEFFRRFVLDPPRYEVNTKMPKLAVDGVSTKIRTHFDGDARQQFEALWNYIQSLEEQP
ncbi:MAG TPA: LamG-like jellyroll fold domain-containing protein, partial [Planctomicrobium sp.]|nr:LamG-like jellyroll fold domain-containing protein [Planctomicrobium sp.]